MNSYGVMKISDFSPLPVTERFDVDEAKVFLRSQTSNSDEDVLIEAYISAARGTAEILQTRDLVPKQWDLYMDAFFCDQIELRHPLRSVDLIRYTDSDLVDHDVDPTDYFVDIHRGVVMPAYNKSWPSFTASPSSSVLIRFTSGYDNSSAFWSHNGKVVDQGMRALVTQWYWKRIQFVPGEAGLKELPYTISQMLGFGALDKAR